MPAPLDPDGLFRTLDHHGVDYVLIGGLAALVHGSTAMTNDADICPSPEAGNLARLSDALRALDARIRVIEDPAGVAFDPHPALLASVAVLNLTTRSGDLDIALRPAGIDNYEALRDRSERFDLYGIEVHVAALADIIRSKEAAGRPKDHATLPILRALEDELGNR